MKFSNRLMLLILAVLLWPMLSSAAEEFKIKNIKIEGLQRITPETVFSYFPIHAGETYTEAKSSAAITELYKTGFFSDVQLLRSGDVLIIHVKERPTIDSIYFTGNKAIKEDKLTPVLKKLGIVEGQPFDSEKVNEIVQGLADQYRSMGYPAAEIIPKVVTESRNRVVLNIQVKEGPIAKIRRITILGNHAFSESKLLQQFRLTTPGLFTWISHRDRYSESALQKDLQSLAEFYLNRGYLRFRVVSQQVVLNKSKTGVIITINIDEGPVYHIGTYTVTGETFGYQKSLQRLITLQTGDIFSRQRVLDFNKEIGDFMSNRGYAFTQVNVIPDIDEARQLVNVNFNVTPGARVYVRRINFSGNQRTDQEVLRRELRQFEASTYRLFRIEESKRRLLLLSYFDDVSYTIEPVPGLSDQVDLNWNVIERAAGKASLQAGYSDLYGFSYGANVTEPNFLGSGKYVSLGFQNTQYQQYYFFQYNNPYYTSTGVSRGFTVYYSHIKPTAQFNIQQYLMEGYGATVNYGIPVSERNALGFGYGYENIDISQVNPQIAAPSVVSFLGFSNATGTTSVGRDYNQFKGLAGWNYNGMDRAIMPTSGVFSGFSLELGLPVIASSIGYFSATYAAKYYQPLFAGFILNLSTTLAYGHGLSDNPLPFYKNFYAGGIGSVPAFAPNSLGPKNILLTGTPPAIGGNLETIFGAHLILPSFTSKLRTAVIFDAGNVFQVPRFPADIAPRANGLPAIVQDDTFALRNLRPSLGIGLDWISPMGPISVTLAYPLNKRQFDETRPFQFTMGLSL